MTAADHNRTLGILFAVYLGLQVLGLIVGVIAAVFMFGFIAQSAPPGEQMPMAFMSVIMVVAFAISALLLIPIAMATWGLLKQRPNARFWTIFGSIVALLSFPLGTALGIYGLWFMFSDEGRALYLGQHDYHSPPPPNVWR